HKKCVAQSRPDSQQTGIGFDLKAVVLPGAIMAVGTQTDACFVDCLIQRNAGRRCLAPYLNAVIMSAVLLEIHRDGDQNVIIRTLAQRLPLFLSHPDDLIGPTVDSNLLSERISA